MPLASTGAPGQDGSQAERDDSEGERGQEREAGGGLAAGPGATAPAGQERAAAPRIAAGTFECRYAGAMLAHAYLDRAGIGPILTGLDGGPWRRFDQAQIATFTVTALLLGVSSVEGIKALIRSAAGPLTGTAVSPGVDALRPRLAAIADTTDVPALQTALATAMLAMPGHAGGLFYVDDHFVPYTGARPVAMGHNGKRDRCEKGRADTLICDARGRAVCFTSAEPTHLSKTMQPALRQLREIVPDGPVLLGFDRGGAYAEAFTACLPHLPARQARPRHRHPRHPPGQARPQNHPGHPGRRGNRLQRRLHRTVPPAHPLRTRPRLHLPPDRRPGRALPSPHADPAGPDQRPDRFGAGPAVRPQGPLGDRERV